MSERVVTETLLQKLEEKVMLLLTDNEESRREIQRLTHENTALKTEREAHAKKLTDLISLLDTVSTDIVMPSTNIQTLKPVLVQGN